MFAFFFGVTYELQGPAYAWWRYTDKDVANGALDERMYGMPLMAAYFHCAMGFGVALAETITQFDKKPTLFRWICLFLLAAPCALLLDGPVRILTALGVSKEIIVPTMLFTILVLPLLLSIGKTKLILKHSDWLLFAIPCLWNTYFLLANLWNVNRGPVTVTPDMQALVCFGGVTSLVLHHAVDLGSGSHLKVA